MSRPPPKPPKPKAKPAKPPAAPKTKAAGKPPGLGQAMAARAKVKRQKK